MEASRQQQLMVLQQGQHEDNTVVRIQSPSWRRTWEVPQQLISMTPASIARLMTDAVLPSHLITPSSAAGSGTALTSSSSPPPASSVAEHIQQAHDVLIGLASSHSAIKCWLYLRMFWLCQGYVGGDALVLEKIAHIEGFAVNSATAHRRWDRVKRGMAVMEVLLNQRQALVDLVGCRTVLLDQLILLPARYLKESVLLHLIREVRITEQAAEAAGGTKRTVARLEKMCKLYIDPPTPEADVADTAAILVSASHQRRRREQGAVEQSTPSKRQRSMPQRLVAVDDLPTSQPISRRRAHTPKVQSASVPSIRSSRSDSPVDAVSTGSESNEEDDEANVNNSRSRAVRSTGLSGNADNKTNGDGKNELERSDRGGDDDLHRRISPAAVITPTAIPTARILHDALVRMHSVPVLQYYLRLLRQFPDLLSVAAPYAYADDDSGRLLYDSTVQHRLQDQCTSRLLLYTNEYLLKHSDELQLLPAWTLDSEEVPTLSCSTDAVVAAHRPTKVWLFFPDEENESNSAKALAVYHRFYSHLYNNISSSSVSSLSSSSSSASTLWDVHGGRLVSLPAELLLQAGVRVLLVVQRAGETVSMPGSSPSRYGSPCAHMVHTLPSAATLSVAGNYCSSQHLVDHLEHQWASSSAVMMSCPPPAQQMERVEVKMPAGVFSDDSPLPAAPLLKPSQQWLQKRYKEMGDDAACDRQAWASELQTPEQMLFLLNSQFDHDIAATTTRPSPALLLKMGRLVRKAPTEEDGDRLTALYTKAIAMSTAASTLQPHGCCALRHGCGLGMRSILPPLPAGAVATHGAVFRFSSAVHLRPLLFLRSPKSVLQQQQLFADEMISQWANGGDRYHYNVSWPTSITPSYKTVGDNSEDVVAGWLERTNYRRMEKPTPFLRHHLHPAHTTYLQDVSAHNEELREKTIARLESVLPSTLVRGGALRHCSVPTDGVHRPSFYLLRSSSFSLTEQVASAALSDMHNESQRLGFWHHLLPCDAIALKGQHFDTGAGEADAVQKRVDTMYKVYRTLTQLPAAADAFARASRTACRPSCQPATAS